MAAVTPTGSLTIRFSGEMSQRLRDFAAEMGDNSPEAITKFVEDTVSRRLFLAKTQRIRERFAHMSPDEIDNLVEDALTWARSPEGRACE
jgi:succinate dehydrogenase/fumarate reductase flavoprotein subunit